MNQSPEDPDLSRQIVQALTYKATAAAVLKGAETACEIRKTAQQKAENLVRAFPDNQDLVNDLVDLNL